MEKLFFIVVTLGLPIIFLLYALVKREFVPLLLGIAAFVVSQVLIRIPILQYVAQTSSAYRVFAVTEPVLYLLVLALSAGVMEELARFLAMRFLLKWRTLKSGVVFGFGHGGIEALLLVGLPVVLTSMHVATAGDLWISGFERICAMAIHICLSLIVLIAVRRQQFWYVVLAIGIHTSINFIAGYFVTTQSLFVVELVLALLTIGLIGLTIQLSRRNFYEKEIIHVH